MSSGALGAEPWHSGAPPRQKRAARSTRRVCLGARPPATPQKVGLRPHLGQSVAKVGCGGTGSGALRAEPWRSGVPARHKRAARSARRARLGAKPPATAQKVGFEAAFGSGGRRPAPRPTKSGVWADPKDAGDAALRRRPRPEALTSATAMARARGCCWRGHGWGRRPSRLAD